MINMKYNSNEFESFKDRIIVRPLNYDDNLEKLKDAVYRLIGDMALTLYIYVATNDFSENTILTTMRVTKDMFDEWGIDESSLFNMAMANTNRLFPPRIYNTIEELRELRYEVGDYMAKEANFAINTTYVASVFTTIPVTNGSISFFYPGVKEKIAEMAGEDYYVVFTSISDFRIHPVSEHSCKELYAVLCNMNSINSEYETFTRYIYKYDIQTGKLLQLENRNIN